MYGHGGHIGNVDLSARKLKIFTVNTVLVYVPSG